MRANIGGHLPNLFEDSAADLRAQVEENHARNLDAIRQVREQLRASAGLGIFGTILSTVGTLLPVIGGLFSKPKGPYGDIKVAAGWSKIAARVNQNLLDFYLREQKRTEGLLQRAAQLIGSRPAPASARTASTHYAAARSPSPAAPKETSIVEFSVLGLIDYDNATADQLRTSTHPTKGVQPWGYAVPPAGKGYPDLESFRAPAQIAIERMGFELREQNDQLERELAEMERITIDAPINDAPAGWAEGNSKARTIVERFHRIDELNAKLRDLATVAEEGGNLALAGRLRGRALLSETVLRALQRKATPGDRILLDGEMRTYQLAWKQAHDAERYDESNKIADRISYLQALLDWSAGSDEPATVRMLESYDLGAVHPVIVIVGLLIVVGGAVLIAPHAGDAINAIFTGTGTIVPELRADLKHGCLELLREGKVTPEFCRLFTKDTAPSPVTGVHLGLGLGALALAALGLWAFSRR